MAVLQDVSWSCPHGAKVGLVPAPRDRNRREMTDIPLYVCALMSSSALLTSTGIVLTVRGSQPLAIV
eukprot:COSAG01_NODE_19933_length_981_cov_0.833333_1_plen_66_part_10